MILIYLFPIKQIFIVGQFFVIRYFLKKGHLIEIDQGNI